MSATQRHFDPITVPAEAGRRRVHRIKCSQCPAVSDVSANTYGGSRNHDDLLKVWKRGGWTVGRNPRHDVCPQCAMMKRRAGRNKQEEERPMTTTTPEPLNAKVIAMPMSHTANAEPPRKPTFDEKRVINAKIEEVYIDEKTGYSFGWTDKRVAEDLGVPRAWVAELRELNFGPAKENEEIRAALEEARALRDEAHKAINEAKSVIGSLTARADALTKSIPPLTARAADLDKRIGLIEKALR